MPWICEASIQTIEGAGIEAVEAARLYFSWLHETLDGVRVAVDGDDVGMHLLGSTAAAIMLRQTHRNPNRVEYRVVGGYLVADEPGGVFVFESTATDGLRISLEGFTPRLPPLVYAVTHSIVHERVMRRFCRHLTECRLMEE